MHQYRPEAWLAGLAAALTLACSDASSPTTGSPSPSELTSASAPTLTSQHSGTTNRLQAISALSHQVAWASGTGGTYTVTRNGGETWHAAVVPGAEDLEFRDVEAIGSREAYLLSAGFGDDARIYHTVDGGRTWTLQFVNREEAAFFDCFAFWGPDEAIVMVDAVNGKFPIRRTLNGRIWNDIRNKLPPAQPGEAAFAASGTCAATQGSNNAWLATGAAENARILATTDRGESWKVYETPIVQGTPVSGIFTVAFRDPLHGVLAGGDLDDPDHRQPNFAVSSDGGKTWKLTRPAPIPGAVFGLSYVAGHDRGPFNRRVMITGPGGAAWTPDEGETWTRLQGVRNFWAVGFASREVGWLVGTDGRIEKVTF